MQNPKDTTVQTAQITQDEAWMIYITILIFLMIMSATLKIISMYLGIPQYTTLADAMNNLTAVVLIIKSSVILTTFVIGEMRNESKIKA